MFPKIGDGVWADAKIGDNFHLPLLSTETRLGPGAAIYEMKTNEWFSNREWADSIEDGQQRAERIARSVYKSVGLKEPFPALVWKKTGER